MGLATKRRIACLAVALAFATPAVAQTRTAQFEIPAQALSSALLNFSTQSGVSVALPRELAGSYQVKPLSGAYRHEEALRLLLEGTDLAFSFVDAQTVQIVRKGRTPARNGALVPDVLGAPMHTVSGSAQSMPSSTVTIRERAEELIVTGTRIRGVAPIGSELITLNREQIERTGYTTTAEVLRSIPQNSALGADEGHSRALQGGNNLNYGTGVNLRGLGTDATLVLLNGRRMAAASQGEYVDVSQIPVSAIERIEVLPDGASAIYGSDAIGGVVNIRLRRDYDGADSEIRTGIGSGFRTWTVNQAMGRTWDSGSITVGFEYYSRTHLSGTARDYYTNDLRPFGGPDLRFTNSNPGTISANGTTYALPLNQNGTKVNAAGLVAGTSNLQDNLFGLDILPSQRRNSATLFAEQRVIERLTLSVDGLFTRRRVDSFGNAAVGTIVVPSTNPFFVTPVSGARTVNVLYSYFDDFGPQRTTGQVTNYSGAASLRYEFPSSWRAEATAAYGTDRVRLHGEGLPNAALMAPYLASSDPAVAFNPFGDGSFTNPATLNAIRGYSDTASQFVSKTLNVQASGELMQISGRQIRVAFGGDYREERLESYSTLFATTLTPTVAALTNLHRRVVAGFGEINIPLLAAGETVGWIERADVSVAGRTERYSDFGRTNNPKIGAQIAILGGLQLRGSLGRSFKAPRLVQAGGAQGISTTMIANPNVPSRTSPVIARTGLANPDLTPEHAKTRSLGFDYRPVWAPEFNLSATYFDIRYNDKIQALSTGALAGILTNPASYGGQVQLNPSAAVVNALYADPTFSPAAVKYPAAQIAAIVDFRPQNVAKAQLAGLDIAAGYHASTGLGEIGATVAATYITRFRLTPSPGAMLTDLRGVIGNPVDLRLRGGVSWSRGGLSAAGYANFTNDYRNTTVTPAERVQSWTTFDANLSFDLAEALGSERKLLISLNCQNLFDRDPPYVTQTVARFGYDPESANANGRVIGLSLRGSW